MSDRSQWLAQTTEQALDPDQLICDPHHHLWDYPESHYLVEEFLRDVGSGHCVKTTVYVECRRQYRQQGPEKFRPVGETEFIDQLVNNDSDVKESTRVAAGIIGYADLTLGSEVRPVLEAHMQASDRFRGIRYMSAWDASDRIHNSQTNPPEHLLLDHKFREGFACLDELGLTFDAWVYHPQLLEVADLAQTFPHVTIVLNHAGGPLGIGPYAGKRDEVFHLWKNHIAELAQCENIFVKLGGMTMSMSGFGWHKLEAPPSSSVIADALRPYFETCIHHFGADRCMFESNFPVDKISCTYTVLWNAFKRLSRDYSSTERAALSHDTATRVYRLE